MSCQSLDEWFDTPLGEYLVEREQCFFDREVSDVFGYHAVQLGLSTHDFLQTSRIPLRVRAGGNGAADLLLDYCQLPLETGSVDLVVLPHVLEFSRNPHQILREVDRVMRPEGQLLLSGFNPFSLWGAKRLLRREPSGFPWNGRFLSLPRVKDWFALLGLEVVSGKLCCYAPPFEQREWLERCHFMEAAGDRWWPISGGVYFLRAIKRVRGLRLIRPSWDGIVPVKGLAPAVERFKADPRSRKEEE